MEWTFKERFVIRVVDSLDPWDFESISRSLFVSEFQGMRPDLLMTSEQQKRDQELKALQNGRYTLRIGAFENDKLIGWSCGWQESGHCFYMGNSAVLPQYRREGIYTELVKAVLRITKETGFQKISSNHVSGNNAVIIAKLKLGFSISGTELSDWAGMLVRLVYYHNELKREFYEFRSGLKPASSEVYKKLISLKP